MKQTHLQELVMPWFESMPDAALISALTATAIGVGSLLIIYMFTRRLLLPGIQKVVTRLSPERIGALTPMLNKLNRRFAGILCCVLYLATFDYVYPVHDVAALVLKTVGQIALIIYGGFILSSVVSIAGGIY
ncbi:MAG: mechanosensitive ion channel family protein, partial [Pseudomonadota bacterium]|nr:mechanosensitive ion channel family protein [Pseudomonadota bacterium]